MQRVFIAGVAGFIGRYVAQQGWAVIGIDSSNPVALSNLRGCGLLVDCGVSSNTIMRERGESGDGVTES